LETFIYWPNHLQYASKQELMQQALEKLALPKMSKSFANRRWWIAELFLEIFRPLMVPAFSSKNISLEKTFDSRIKTKGKRGSFCFLVEQKHMGPIVVDVE
jgi:hypothetical protein